MRVRLSRTNAIASSGVPAPHRQNGANVQRQRQEPRTGVSKHRCGLIEQAFRLARRRRSRGRPTPARSAHCPVPQGIRQRPEPFDAAGETGRGPRRDCRRRVRRARTDCSACATHVHVAGAVGERQGARERGACALEFSLRVPHQCRARRALSTRRRAEGTAGSESVRTTGGLRPHVRGSARRTSAPTRCRTLRRDGRAR